jgi:hypothetical protein
MFIKGRENIPSGERHPNSKLRPEFIQVIKDAADKGFYRFEIAKYFGVSKNTINDVVCGRTWK